MGRKKPLSTLGKSAKHYRSNPKSLAKKYAYAKKYNAKPRELAKRRELEGKQIKGKGVDGETWDRDKEGKLLDEIKAEIADLVEKAGLPNEDENEELKALNRKQFRSGEEGIEWTKEDIYMQEALTLRSKLDKN